MISGRALHFVFKIGDRAKNIFFFRNILGMKILRHEEFQEGCEAKCNGPYDDRWSKTLVGYGIEHDQFTLELTYNYRVKSYKLGNDFGGVTIRSSEILERAKQNSYPVSKINNLDVILSPDGHKFFIIDDAQPTAADKNPIEKIAYNVTNLEKSLSFWNGIIDLTILEKQSKKARIAYDEKRFALELIQIDEPIDRAESYGRIAFAVPYDQQPKIDELVRKNNVTIHTPLVSLDTPGKATVRVVIVTDPDGHEICFVDEEGFTALSEFDPDSEAAIDKYIAKDPFQ